MSDFSRRLMVQILGAAAVAGCSGGDETAEADTHSPEGGSAGQAAGQSGSSGHPTGSAGTSGHGGAGGGSAGAGPAGHGGAGEAGAAGKAGAAGDGGAAGTGGGAGEGGAGSGGSGGSGGGAGKGGSSTGGAGKGGSAGSGGKEPDPTADDLLNEIDHFVVVMMENRSFDHFFGSLQRDKTYKNDKSVEGTDGTESNPWPGHSAVKVYKADTYSLDDPPHSFAAAHTQYNSGKNDHFVIQGAASKGDKNDTGNTFMDHPKHVMANYERAQIPFYHWLADTFAIADHWHCAVLGPTYPNRCYVHAGTSYGMKTNDVVSGKIQDPIWNRLATAKKSGANYYASGSLYGKIFANKIKATKVNPDKKISEFFKAASDGKLPNVSYIEPDYGTNSDHPTHDIRKGQAFVASIYQALAKSPQWSKSLLIVIYDENGGFFDHVPPPAAKDDHDDFKRHGFRIPAIFIGPTVKTGHLSKTLYDHASVVATLAHRFGLPKHGARENAANLFTDVLDKAKYKKPLAPPTIPAKAQPKLSTELIEQPTVDGQPELTAAIEAGELPAESFDVRAPHARQAEWLQIALDLGAVTIED